MQSLFNIMLRWGVRRISVPMLFGIFLPTALLFFPLPSQAQGPSIAAEQLWANGRDLAPLFGVVVTLRPPGSGVAISGEWLIGRGPRVSHCLDTPESCTVTSRFDLRLLRGSVGYSARLPRRLGIEFYVRPALGLATIKRGGEGKSFFAISGDIEASRPLFGIDRLRGLLGFNGSLGIPFKTRKCQDCHLLTYEHGFSSAAVLLGIMMEIR